MAELKRVSFAVAKAIREAGYPQYGSCEKFYDTNGKVVDKMCDMHKLIYPCPTYLEVWLWLWREKRICIDADSVWIKNRTGCSIMIDDKNVRFIERNDPEEAIIAATEYLVDNNLVK